MSQLHFVKHWPSPQHFGIEVLLIYDRIFERVPVTSAWVKKFPRRYAVTSGETLKDLQRFPSHVQALQQVAAGLTPRRMKIIALGGGSVGDFAGFFASVFKRGVELIHIPSTWLAAFDSAHGGKTALNVGGAKNQIGTFYPANDIYLVKPLLMAQPKDRSFEALGELLKIALLSGGDLFKKLQKVKSFNAETLWTFLPAAIAEKNKIVKKDPQEKSGHRQLLNFGHTMGHVFESHYGLPHGVAVLAGLQFALEWSYEKRFMNQGIYLQLMNESFWRKAVEAKQRSPWKQLSMMALLSEKPKIFEEYLKKDKKKSGAQSLKFIFLKSPGKPVMADVTWDELRHEIGRQAAFWN